MTERTIARVYTYWDDYRRKFVTAFDRWATEPETVDAIELPEGFDIYRAEGGNWYAYDVTTESRDEGERQDAWRVVRMRGTFALVDAYGDDESVIPCRRATGPVDDPMIKN